MRAARAVAIAVILCVAVPALAMDERAWTAFVAPPEAGAIPTYRWNVPVMPLVPDAPAVFRRLEAQPIPLWMDERIVWLIDASMRHGGVTLPTLARYPHIAAIAQRAIARYIRAADLLRRATCITRLDAIPFLVDPTDFCLTSAQLDALKTLEYAGPLASRGVMRLLNDQSPAARAYGLLHVEAAAEDPFSVLELLHDRSPISVLWASDMESSSVVKMTLADLAGWTCEAVIAHRARTARLGASDDLEREMWRIAEELRRNPAVPPRGPNTLHCAVVAGRDTGGGPGGSCLVAWIWSYGPDGKAGGGDDVIREATLNAADEGWLAATGGVVSPEHAPPQPAHPCVHPVTPLTATDWKRVSVGEVFSPLDEREWKHFVSARRLDLGETAEAAVDLACHAPQLLARIEDGRAPNNDRIRLLEDESLGHTVAVSHFGRYTRAAAAARPAIDTAVDAAARLRGVACVALPDAQALCDERLTPDQRDADATLHRLYGLGTPGALLLLHTPTPAARLYGLELLHEWLATPEAAEVAQLIGDRDTAPLHQPNMSYERRVDIGGYAAFVLQQLVAAMPPPVRASADPTEAAMLRLLAEYVRDPQFHGDAGVDQWGRPLHYATAVIPLITDLYDRTIVWIWSYGPDGRPGGGDDIFREALVGDHVWLHATGGSAEKAPVRAQAARCAPATTP